MNHTQETMKKHNSPLVWLFIIAALIYYFTPVGDMSEDQVQQIREQSYE